MTAATMLPLVSPPIVLYLEFFRQYLLEKALPPHLKVVCCKGRVVIEVLVACTIRFSCLRSVDIITWHMLVEIWPLDVCRGCSEKNTGSPTIWCADLSC